MMILESNMNHGGLHAAMDDPGIQYEPWGFACSDAGNRLGAIRFGANCFRLYSVSGLPSGLVSPRLYIYDAPGMYVREIFVAFLICSSGIFGVRSAHSSPFAS
jgi:hypothetical protein